MVDDPPTRLTTNGHSSGKTLTKNKSERKGERLRSLVRLSTKAVKEKPYRGVHESNKTVCGRRTAARVSLLRARTYGQRVIAVLLTGMLDDGTAGLMAVKMRGGVVIVQNPDDALFSDMPRNAIDNVDDIDHIVPLSDIPSILVGLVSIPMEIEAENPIPSRIEFETEIAQFNLEAVENESDRPGKPSTFGCPDCGGILWKVEEGNLLRFRCRTGHAYSAETLLATQSDAIEDALWIALRANALA
jgi:hypothetical protein